MPRTPAPPVPDVLVIEDDRDMASLLGTHLSRLGCRVRTETTGEDGLAAAERLPPDVVLVDVRLAGIGGRAVVRTLRSAATTRGCRIVLIRVIDARDLVDVASDAVLPSPFSRRDVARALSSLDFERTG